MKTFKELCPFREGSASHKIYMVLADSKQPLKVLEIAKRAKVPLAKAQTLTAAYFNPFHCASLTRVGVEFQRKDDGIVLGRCTPNPKATRPERGLSKKRRKAAKAGTSKPMKASKPKPQAVKPMPVVAALAVPSHEPETK